MLIDSLIHGESWHPRIPHTMRESRRKGRDFTDGFEDGCMGNDQLVHESLASQFYLRQRCFTSIRTNGSQSL